MPQNSSTESKVMTSFKRSFQLSPCITIRIERPPTYNPGRSYLATWGLGEPESPLVLERVLDIEVVFVMEHSDVLVVLGIGSGLALGIDGDGGEIDLLVLLGCLDSSGGHCG